MAATTTLLGLLTPTQGTLSGTWGDSVNYGISDYLDIAIAGTLSFAGDGAITLANTTGSSAGNAIVSTTAQYMVIRITGTQTVVKVITGPSYSKLYMVDHAGATSAVTFKAAGQTGVSVAVGEKCFVYYNGTDYVKVASSVADGVTSVAMSVPAFLSVAGSPITSTGTLAVTLSGTALPVANGGTGLTSFTANGVVYASSTSALTTGSALTFDGSQLGVGVSSPGQLIDCSAANPRLRFTATSTGYAASQFANTSGSSYFGRDNSAGGFFGIANGTVVYSSTNDPIGFFLGTSEQMRLTSTGLGIGTSSPTSPLTVAGTSSVNWIGGGNSTGTATIATQGTGGSLLVQTPSVNSSYASGFGVDGTYSSVSGKSVINLKALGANSGGPYNADMAFFTSVGTTLSERMRLDSSGNVGIGTSSSATKLQINKTSQAPGGTTPNGALLITNLAGGDGCLEIGSDSSVLGYLQVRNRISATYYDFALQPGGGNVGIGTSSPGAKLEVAATSNAAAVEVLRLSNNGSGANTQARINFVSSGTSYSTLTGGYGASAPQMTFNLPSATAGNYVWQNVSVENMRLDSSGNLGIGTSSPTARVHALSGTSMAQMTVDGTGAIKSGINFANGGTTYGQIFFDNNAPYDMSVMQQVSTGSLRFGTNNTERARISSDGTFRVKGAGSAGSTDAFQVAGGAPADAARLDASGRLLVGTTSTPNSSEVHQLLARSGSTFLQFQNLSTATGCTIGTSGENFIIFTNTNTIGGGGGAYTERARIDSSGNLLVGTTTVAAKLTVEQTGGSANGASITNQSSGYQTLGLHNKDTSGNNTFVTFVTDASSFRGSITFNRTAGLVAYNTTSDYRAKDISGPVTDSGALIDATPVYMGKMKGATQERPMFIAHEVPAYAHTGEKDAVDADGNPVYQQMDASALVPVMWAEIQSLRQRLAAAGI